MRHEASLMRALEGMSRPAFRIARELALNSRAGLTVRFLAKKLDLPEEEVEYLIDLSPRIFYPDLTKVKVVAGGVAAIKRVREGLENRGDVESMFRIVKAMESNDFRRFEERLGVDGFVGKTAAAQQMVRWYYRHPDSIVDLVAKSDFSPVAQEVFDLVWQSPEGLVPVSKLRAEVKDSEFDVEQALTELFEGLALFELFRFDAEDRLVRVAALLAEIRHWRQESTTTAGKQPLLKAAKLTPACETALGLEMSDRAVRLTSAIAAKPARFRNDGSLYREDLKRLGEICPEEGDLPLLTLLWAVRTADWIAEVDNELRAADLEALVDVGRLERHRRLFAAVAPSMCDEPSQKMLVQFADELKPNTWYSVMDFVRYACRRRDADEVPGLRKVGGHWQYLSPGANPSEQRALVRALHECYMRFGVVDIAEADDETLFRLTDLGQYLLLGKGSEALAKRFPEPRNEFVVQPNFDIVVPTRDLDPLLLAPLEQFAARQGTGEALVYNLSKESFTKAVQEGHDSGAFLSFLLKHNRGGGLPSNVLRTLEDWRGGMKRVRFRTIHVLETDDPLVAADLMHRRRYKDQLEALDGQTLLTYKRAQKSRIRKDLEKDGFVVE